MMPTGRPPDPGNDNARREPGAGTSENHMSAKHTTVSTGRNAVAVVDNMRAPIIIDVVPVQIEESERLLSPRDGASITDARDGYQGGAAHPPITESEQLSRFQKRTTITDDPSKGLSKLQRQILGTAYTMHVYGAQPRAGNIPDYVTPLGVFVIFHIVPNLSGRNARFTRTPQVASAQAALSRAVTRLMERKLLAWRHSVGPTVGGTGTRHIAANGYVLTAAGAQIGALDPVLVPLIERCQRYFGMAELSNWRRDPEAGDWIAEPWQGSKGAHYEYELIHEDCTVIRTAFGAAK